MPDLTPNCRFTESDMTTFLIEGAPIPADHLAHIRSCARCSAIAARVSELGALLEESLLTLPGESLAANADIAQRDVEATDAVATAVRVAHKRRQRLRAFIAGAIAVIAVTTWIMTRSLLHVRHPDAIWIALMTLFAGPLVVAYITAGLERVGPSRLYKRMKGRELSGVCRGIADATGIPVWVVRMAFVALLFLKGIGLIAYLLLDLFLPIRPEERAELLRFRLMRWWSRRQHA